jgi:hypothetical protein
MDLNLIKVGLETAKRDLCDDMLLHPCRYFFILMIENQAALCIRTCDSQGEELQSHVVDGLVADSDGNLASIFEEDISTALKEQKEAKISSDGELLIPISPAIAEKIRLLPGLIDWIISYVLTRGRNIVIYPASWIV